jgi:hypothetical protein
MNSNQFLKWRKDVLTGKIKYYPKHLIPNLIAFNVDYEERDKVVEQIRKELDEAEKKILEERQLQDMPGVGGQHV